MELTKEWNNLQTRAQRGVMDLLDYEEEMGLWMERHRIRSSLKTLSEYDSIVDVSYPEAS